MLRLKLTDAERKRHQVLMERFEVGRIKGKQAAVSRETVIAKALELLQDDGFETLSLGRIAKAIGVQTPALYWYFENRAELDSALSEVIFREAMAKLSNELTGRELLHVFGHALRKTLFARRDAAKLAVMTAPSDAIVNEIIPALVTRISLGGFTTTQAMEAQIAVQSLALGWSMFEINPSIGATMRKAINPDRAFEEALTSLCQGFPAD